MKAFIKTISPYFILTILVFVLLQVFYKFMNVDLTVPLAIDRDHVLGYSLVKSFMEHQWGIFEIPQNIYLGAPDKSFMGDFPIFDSNLMWILMLQLFLVILLRLIIMSMVYLC